MEAFDQAFVHFKEVTGFVDSQRSDEDDQMPPGPNSPKVNQTEDGPSFTVFWKLPILISPFIHLAIFTQ